MLRYDELSIRYDELSIKSIGIQHTRNTYPVSCKLHQGSEGFLFYSAIPVLHRQELQFLEKADYYTTNF